LLAFNNSPYRLHLFDCKRLVTSFAGRFTEARLAVSIEVRSLGKVACHTLATGKPGIEFLPKNSVLVGAEVDSTGRLILLLLQRIW